MNVYLVKTSFGHWKFTAKVCIVSVYPMWMSNVQYQCTSYKVNIHCTSLCVNVNCPILMYRTVGIHCTNLCECQMSNIVNLCHQTHLIIWDPTFKKQMSKMSLQTQYLFDFEYWTFDIQIGLYSECQPMLNVECSLSTFKQT